MVEKARVQFRPVPYIEEIHQAQDRDPAYRYKNVIITYRSDPNRVQRYLKRGWEIVQTTKPNIDDRSNSAASKSEKLRPQMLVETTNDGHEQILMRILWSLDEKNQLGDKEHREKQKYMDAKKRGEKITKRGSEIITEGSEVNENMSFDSE